jgi:hypothetical protein
LQFSILHLLGAMTAVGVLLAGAAAVRWMVRNVSNEEFFLAVAFAVVISLAILIVCWAVLGTTQVGLRLAITVPMVPGLALLLLYAVSEWDFEATVIVCSLGCFVYGMLALTFWVLRTAGFRFGRQLRATHPLHADGQHVPPRARQAAVRAGSLAAETGRRGRRWLHGMSRSQAAFT